MGKDSADLDDLIENVAIATIGDVMDLEDENRIFVKEGLQMLRRTKNPGLKALIECTGIDKNSLNSYHIGFVLGPCINASGRLDTAKRALELLRAGTQKEADILAGDLKALNDSRKDMTEEAVNRQKSRWRQQPFPRTRCWSFIFRIVMKSGRYRRRKDKRELL